MRAADATALFSLKRAVIIRAINPQNGSVIASAYNNAIAQYKDVHFTIDRNTTITRIDPIISNGTVVGFKKEREAAPADVTVNSRAYVYLTFDTPNGSFVASKIVLGDPFPIF